jgi:hypothetical protein
MICFVPLNPHPAYGHLLPFPWAKDKALFPIEAEREWCTASIADAVRTDRVDLLI